MKPEKPPIECFGAEASAAYQAAPARRAPRSVWPTDAEARDRFGRLLAYVYRTDDDLFVNQWLLDGGYADAVFYRTQHHLPLGVHRGSRRRATGRRRTVGRVPARSTARRHRRACRRRRVIARRR